MGNWQLEVGKFALYVFIPVAAFYMYHQVDYFKDDLLRYERRTNTSQVQQNEALLKEYFDKLRDKRDDQLKQKLQTLEQNSK